MQNPSRQDHKVALCFFVAEGNQPNIWNNMCFIWELLYQRLWWWSGIGHSCSLTQTGDKCIQSIHVQTFHEPLVLCTVVPLGSWQGVHRVGSVNAQPQGAGCINIAQILAVLPGRTCVLWQQGMVLPLLTCGGVGRLQWKYASFLCHKIGTFMS